MSQDYVFQNTPDQAELTRLQAIEALFDPVTRRLLTAAGLKPGHQCLEVGAGAGSVAAWMAQQAGSSGTVTAVDLNTRFLESLPTNVRVLSGDVNSLPLKSGSFDLIHTRYVLVHIPDPLPTLERLWSYLKPGGSMVVEEPDFTCYKASDGGLAGLSAFDKVHRAINRMYMSKGIDPALGTKIPRLLRKLGVEDVLVEIDAPVSEGGGGIAEMMRLSSLPLRDRYLATGLVTPADLDDYDAFARSKASRAVYYATVGVIGRKPE